MVQTWLVSNRSEQKWDCLRRVFYGIDLVDIQHIGAKMGLPPARAMASGVTYKPGARRRLSRFLRAYRARPKKAGQFPPQVDCGLSVYAHVHGRYVFSGLFVLGGGEQSHFSWLLHVNFDRMHADT